jgi:hypothetical protein
MYRRSHSIGFMSQITFNHIELAPRPCFTCAACIGGMRCGRRARKDLRHQPAMVLRCKKLTEIAGQILHED